ncbi:MAG: efflux RND transporter periplasmic adaptor subunit [Lentisphaeria bacterium]
MNMPLRILLGLLAVCVLAFGCGRQGGSGPAAMASAPVPVTVAAVQTASWPSAAAYAGTVESRQAVQVSTRTMARIIRIAVTEGQAVQPGDLLVELDDTDARSALSQAEAALASAMVARDNAALDLGRYTRLVAEKAATPRQLEAVQAALAAATARVHEVEANVAQARNQLGYSRLTAPAAGVVARKWLDAGNLAVPGAPILTLENPALVEAVVAVPEETGRRLAAGQPAAVELAAAGRVVNAVIRVVVATADPATRTVTVRLAFPELPPGVLPGQFVQVRFSALAAPVLAMPAAAVIRQGQMTGAFVVAGGRAALTWLQLGREHDAHVEVLAGLHPGDTVVAPVSPGLADGLPVAVRP